MSSRIEKSGAEKLKLRYFVGDTVVIKQKLVGDEFGLLTGYKSQFTIRAMRNNDPPMVTLNETDGIYLGGNEVSNPVEPWNPELVQPLPPPVLPLAIDEEVIDNAVHAEFHSDPTSVTDIDYNLLITIPHEITKALKTGTYYIKNVLTDTDGAQEVSLVGTLNLRWQ